MSLKDECYTPKKYIEAARSVMGTITCDPASSEFGNKRVKALEYFSIKDNAFNHLWKGNIWLNSPYSSGKLFLFTNYLITEFENKNTKQAIQLIPNDTSTRYFKILMTRYIACFVDHRIRFINDQNQYIGKSADFGNIFFYLGENRKKFAEIFKQFGTIVTKFS